MRDPLQSLRKILALCALIGVLAACGGGGKTDNGETSSPPPVTPSVTVVKGTA